MEKIYAAAAAAKSLQSCPPLCDTKDGSPPGFPIPGILQARTLEWVAISGEVLYSQQKQDQELTMAQIMNSLLPNSDSNWRK